VKFSYSQERAHFWLTNGSDGFGSLDSRPRKFMPTMKSILSGVLRRKDAVVQRNGWAGVLPIEFIERSRNEYLGIECLFAAYGEENEGATGTLEGEGGTSGVEDEGSEGLRGNSGSVADQRKTDFC
jgi:hypothetical protein